MATGSVPVSWLLLSSREVMRSRLVSELQTWMRSWGGL